MSVQSEHVKKWRLKTKERMVKAMGGKCVCCEYDKCLSALTFHHIDPEKKLLTFGKVMANPCKWLAMVEELKKCVMLCRNCHAEVHAGITEVPADHAVFDEKYTVYRNRPTDACPICGEQKPIVRKTCSRVCAGKSGRKVDWDNVDLAKILCETKNFSKIGRLLGVSGTSVKKRAKKLGLIV